VKTGTVVAMQNWITKASYFWGKKGNILKPGSPQVAQIKNRLKRLFAISTYTVNGDPGVDRR